MADDLDSIVKGVPVPAAVQKVQATSPGTTPILAVSGRFGDPLNHAPSSPSMVYLNLLILEASLRAQFLELRARRRHHNFFLALLTLWVAFFAHLLFFAAREDGRGVGGSAYWAFEGTQRVCFMGGIITAVLVWATGICERGIRWPRRWFAISNRGLRAFNCKLVVIRRSWWAEALSTVAFFLTYGLFSHTASSSYRHVHPSLLRETEKELQRSNPSYPTLILPHEDEDQGGHEEDLAPGGDYVKLLLLAKPFSATFREKWELYRTEYWERENERRALLRQKVQEHDRRLAKQLHGWLWWLPWRQMQSSPLPQQQQQHQSHHHKPHAGRLSGSDKARKHSNSSLRRPSVSSSSRSQTPSLDVSDGQASRRPRSGSGASEKRRKKPDTASRPSRSAIESRSTTPTPMPTPETPSPLAREAENSRAVGGSAGGRAKERHQASK